MTTDFSQARSALSNALNTAGPILVALQQAEVVFGVLANAEKHKKVLETEVADYKAELDKTKAAVQKQQQKLKDITAEIVVAEADADAKIKAAIEEEKAKVSAAKAQAAAAISASSASAAEAMQADATKLAQYRASNEQAMAELAAQKVAMETSIATLTKKMETLQAQAQKFAAALTAA